jgi:hypothetical protein
MLKKSGHHMDKECMFRYSLIVRLDMNDDKDSGSGSQWQNEKVFLRVTVAALSPFASGEGGAGR